MTSRPTLRGWSTAPSPSLSLLAILGGLAGSAAEAAPAVLTLEDGPAVYRVALESGEDLQPGCFRPEQFVLEPAPRRSAGGVATAWDVGDAPLLAVRNGSSGAARYGMPLGDGRLATLPSPAEMPVAPTTTSLRTAIRVLDAATGLPVSQADLLLPAPGGGICWRRTDALGVAVVGEARPSATAVFAADGFVGGFLALPADGLVLLRQARSVDVHIAAPRQGDANDLAVLAFPDQHHREPGDRPLAVAVADGPGVVELRGIPDWNRRVLVAVFRGGVPFGISVVLLDVHDAVAIHTGSGAVVAAPPDPNAIPVIDTVRVERLYEGTVLADFALGRLSERLEFKLKRAEPGLARDDLLAYAWYSVVDAADGPEFFLDAGERKRLGNLAAPNLLTLAVEGLPPTQALEHGWATFGCWGERERQSQTLVTSSGDVRLRLPEFCQGGRGRVRVRSWPTMSFGWQAGDNRPIAVRMGRAGVIGGTVRGADGRPLAGASVRAHWLLPAELRELRAVERQLRNVPRDDAERTGKPAVREELLERYPVYLDPDRRRGRHSARFDDPTFASTAEAGRFALFVPYHGEYRLETTRAGHYAPSATVALGAGPVEIEMRKAVLLSGRIRNAREQPVGASVRWNPYTGEPPSGWTSTDASGAFRFPALPPGRGEVTVHVSGGVPETREFDLRTGHNEIEIRLENPLVRIEGIVIGPSTEVVAEVERVRATPDPPYYRPALGLSAEVAADGTFFLENLSPGRVRLTAVTGSYAALPVEVVIEPTDTVRRTRLELLAKSGRITGRVKSEVSLHGALISAYGEVQYAYAEISASGEFDLTNLAVGVWSLGIYRGAGGTAFAGNFGPLERLQEHYAGLASVELGEGDVRSVEIDLTALPSVALHGGPPEVAVRDEAGNAVVLDANGAGLLRVPGPGIHELRWTIGDRTFYREVTISGSAVLDLGDPPDRSEPVPFVQW